jgi:hypothetical protein
MAKGKSTLFSKISGHFKNADNLTLRTRDGNIILEKYPKPSYTRSVAQDEQRTAYTNAVAAWHAASDEDREKYRPIARKRQITLYNAFISSKLIGELPEGTQIIQVDNTNNSDTLTDYQILLSISEDSQFFTDLSSDLVHVEIYDSDRKTALPFWIESSSSEEYNAKIWIKIPEIPASAQKKIYLIPCLGRTEHLSDFSETFTKEYGESNLVGLWHLDEGTGTTISDSSGNNNTGTTISALWQDYDGGQWAGRSDITFPAGDCLKSQGLDNRITVPHSTSLNFADEFTFEAWIKSGSDAWQTFYEKVISKTGLRICMIGEGRLSITGYDGSGSTRILNGTTFLHDLKWHHIAVTINKSIWKLYVDGTLEGTKDTEYDDTVLSSLTDLTIGANAYNSSQPLIGSMDEIRVYSRGLPAGEIKAHYERRKYTSPEPEISYSSS